jgi:hypothetical protein
MRLPRAWFLPETHDVLGTLTAQIDIVQTVIGVLRAWCAGTGEEDTIGQLRSLLATEHETRRRLHIQVRSSFSTPSPRRTFLNSPNDSARSANAPRSCTGS